MPVTRQSNDAAEAGRAVMSKEVAKARSMTASVRVGAARVTGRLEAEPEPCLMSRPGLGTPIVNRELSRGLFAARSEEHTSELQSLMRISYDVLCWKKKK